MKLERTKNTIRNAWYGMANKIITIIMPFFVRTIFINTFGVEYLGLNSLFISIIKVLSLTELGFNSAIVFCMYKPIAEDDTEAINSLLAFYKSVYRIIGLIILGVGLLLIPLLRYIIKGSYPSDINIVVVYLVFLLNTVISYFMFAYLGALIAAFQREDVVSKVNIFITSTMYIVQIVTLLIIRNYYVYVLIMPIFTVVNNIRTAIIAKKMFPQYSPIGKISEQYKNEIKEKVSGLMLHKVCLVTRNAFDSIFISAFLGLAETAIYNNYYYIIDAVVGLTSVIITAVNSGVGNSVAMETMDKNYEDMNKMNYIYMWIIGWFTTCLVCLYQPFMKIWVGEELMYPMGCVVLICAYFYLLKIGDVRDIYEQAKGLWWENRYRSIAETIGNIGLNYVLGRWLGVYGIILATMTTILVVNFGYGTKKIFKKYYVTKKISDYFLHQLWYGLVTIIVCAITYYICEFIQKNIIGLIMRGVICITIPNLIYYIIYRKTMIYSTSKTWICQRVRRIKY